MSRSLITGDELLPPATPPRDDRFADMNSLMVAALVDRDGGSCRVIGPLEDDRDVLEERLQTALQSSDVVLISGGSSTGPEDHAPGLVAKLGSLEVHGVALRPASPDGPRIRGPCARRSAAWQSGKLPVRL